MKDRRDRYTVDERRDYNRAYYLARRDQILHTKREQRRRKRHLEQMDADIAAIVSSYKHHTNPLDRHE